IIWIAASLAVFASGATPAIGFAQRATTGRDLVRTGRYEEGMAILAAVPKTDSSWLGAQRDLAKAQALTGAYDKAELTARTATAAPGGKELWNTLGEVLRIRGRLAPAESAFTRAVTLHASDSLTAMLNLAVLHHDAGAYDRASKEFDHFISVYNERSQ